MELKELKEKFRKALSDAEAIRLKYQGKAESMTAEEEATWGKHLDEADAYKKQIETLEREESLKGWGKESAGHLPIAGSEGSQGKKDNDGGEGDEGGQEEPGDPAAKTRHLKMIEDISRTDPLLARGMKAATKSAYMAAVKEYIRAKGQFDLMSVQARKDLSEGVDSQGGFFVPEDFRAEIIKKLPTMAEMRNRARVMTTSSDHVIFPKEDYNIDDRYTSAMRIVWVDENPADDDETDASNDNPGQLHIYVRTAMAGKRISNNLIEDSAFDIIGYIQMLLAEAFGLGENDAFLTGSGAGRPYGLFNSANPEFPATVNSGHATEVKSDGLIDLFFALPKQYRNNAVFLMNSMTAKATRKLKDGQNRYLWDAMSAGGLTTRGDQDQLLGKPVVIDEFCPEIAANTYPIAFGDLMGYYILDRVGMSIQVLREKYAERNQIKILGRKRVGGQVGEKFRFRIQKIAA